MAEDPENLQSLVKQRLEELKDKRGLSLEDIVKRARKAGYRITKQRIYQLSLPETRIGQVPYKDTLYALAKGLDLPVLRVADAALRSTGVPVPAVPARRYGRTSDQITVREARARLADFDELTVMLPHEQRTAADIAELIEAVTITATRQRERRGDDTHRADAPESR